MLVHGGGGVVEAPPPARGIGLPLTEASLRQSENPVSAKVPLPSVVVTPFSKKHPPPNDRPIWLTLATAALNPAVTDALDAPFWPFQSDHCDGVRGTLSVAVP